jgi:hypothetical protein
MTPEAFTPQAQPAFTPAYAAREKAYEAVQAAGGNQDSPGANCLPTGMPTIMSQPYPMQILFGPREVTIDIEAFMQVRDTLEVVTTIDDPEALTKPWTTSKIFVRHTDWTIAEYICEQNNRNRVDPNGRAGIILTPPKPGQ